MAVVGIKMWSGYSYPVNSQNINNNKKHKKYFPLYIPS